MSDILTPQVRSRVMSRIRGKDTQPEMHVRREVWRSGFRFRLHAKDLPGKPDLALAKYRLAVFVHGCFWHQHGCARSKRPSSNREFWNLKLERNKARDRRNVVELKKRGWKVRTIWECRLKEDTEELIASLTKSREKISAQSTI